MLLSYFAVRKVRTREISSHSWKEKDWQIREPAPELMLLTVLAYGLVNTCLPVLKEYGAIRKIESQVGNWQINRHGTVQIAVLKRNQDGTFVLPPSNKVVGSR